MQDEIVERSRRAADAQKEIRSLEREAIRRDREIEMCAEVLEKHRAVLGSEVEAECGDRLIDARRKMTEDAEKKERLQEKVADFERAVAVRLDVARKNRLLEAAAKKHESTIGKLLEDAAIIATSRQQGADSD